MAPRYMSSLTPPVISTGLYKLAIGGRHALRLSTVSLEKEAMRRLERSTASAARMAGPPALEKMATRGPTGISWVLKAWAMLKRSSRVSALRTPDCLKAALKALYEPARLPV